MIKSEKEYNKVKAEIQVQGEFLREQKHKLQERGLPPEIIQISVGELERQKYNNEVEVREYEKIVAGEFEKTRCSFSDIGRHLIRLRLWQGITRTELAKRLGIDIAAVSKDERFEYQNVTLPKIRRVLKALEADDLQLTVTHEVETELVAGKDEMAATRKVV